MLTGGNGYLAQLGNAVHQQGYIHTEFLTNVVKGGIGIFNGIVKQGGADGFGIHTKGIDYIRHRNGMEIKFLARIALLARVGGYAKVQRFTDFGAIVPLITRSNQLAQGFKISFFLFYHTITCADLSILELPRSALAEGFM